MHCADDGNRDDPTVMEVTLPKPLPPGPGDSLPSLFSRQVSLSVARTGYTRDFIMGAQWFPKIGVFWHGAWKCHQYHADTEFFADFGTYNVNLTQAAALCRRRRRRPDGRTCQLRWHQDPHFRGEDIHRFAWAATPHFQTADDTFFNSLGSVKLHALIWHPMLTSVIAISPS